MAHWKTNLLWEEAAFEMSKKLVKKIEPFHYAIIILTALTRLYSMHNAFMTIITKEK